MADRFDVVVIGTGPAGEVAISRLLRQGLAVAVPSWRTGARYATSGGSAVASTA